MFLCKIHSYIRDPRWTSEGRKRDRLGLTPAAAGGVMWSSYGPIANFGMIRAGRAWGGVGWGSPGGIAKDESAGARPVWH